MPVIIRIGGSVIASPTDPTLINRYVRLLLELGNTSKIIVVVGGGKLAREFIEIASTLDLDEEAQDWLAIHISRLYALLFNLKLGSRGLENVPTSIDEAAEAATKGKIVIMGGLKPGMTTDTVAAYLVQRTGATLLVKATDQDGIYNKDPKKHGDAKKLETISFHDLEQLFEENQHKAGIHQILDPSAVKILQKTGVKTIVVNGYNPENIKLAIEGKTTGTMITE
ncbi:MAG: UMP kinase [Candidatus Bathyarchaeota archaeon]|nr:MAG: UMP kinase [Candidatus Bathyarchaeota archaeon]